VRVSLVMRRIAVVSDLQGCAPGSSGMRLCQPAGGGGQDGNVGG